MRFDQRWINWMLLRVSTVEYKMCVNGSLVGPVSPSKGLRQSDPLSPYLLCYVLKECPIKSRRLRFQII